MEFVSGNIFVREMRFTRAGDVVQGHVHNFDHTTYVAKGALRVELLRIVKEAVLNAHNVEVEPAQYEVMRAVEKSASDGRNWVLIKAGAVHRITALTDGALGHCIYSHRTAQGEIVEEFDGWGPAYE